MIVVVLWMWEVARVEEEVRESCGGSLIRPPRYPKLGKIGTRFPTRSRCLGNTPGWLTNHSGSWTCTEYIIDI